MSFTGKEAALRSELESAAMLRKGKATHPDEQMLCRARYALVRTRRLAVPPEQDYRVDPVLASFMQERGLVKMLETEEELLAGKSGFRHVLCEITPLGVKIRDTF